MSKNYYGIPNKFNYTLNRIKITTNKFNEFTITGGLGHISAFFTKCAQKLKKYKEFML